MGLEKVGPNIAVAQETKRSVNSTGEDPPHPHNDGAHARWRDTARQRPEGLEQAFGSAFLIFAFLHDPVYHIQRHTA